MAITIGETGEIDTAALARASLVLTPLVLAAARSGNSDWLLAAIVTISAYIAMDRSGLAPLECDSTALNHTLALSACLSMIFSENRFPLFRIML